MADFDETAASAPEFYGRLLELIEKTKFDEAIRQARQERTDAQEKGSKVDELAALRLLIKGQLGKNDSFNAKKSADEAMAIAKGDKKAEAAILHLLALISIKELSADAESAADKAVDAYKALKDKSGEAAAIITKAKVAFSKDDLEKALEKANEAKAEFESSGEKMGEAAALNLVFDIKVKEDRMYHALLIAEQMLSIYVDKRNVPGEAAAQLKAAEAQLDQGDLQNALDRATSAAQLFDDIGDIKKKGAAALLMARAFERVGQLQDAMSTAETAINLFAEGRDKKGGVVALRLIARCYIAENKLGLAASKLEEAAFKYRQIKDKHSEADILVELAETQLAMLQKPDEVPARGWHSDDFEQPVRNARAALKILQDSGKGKTTQAGKALVSIAAGLLALRKQDGALDEAKDKAEEAQSIFGSSADLSGEALSLKVQAQVIFAKDPQDKEQAITVLEKARELAEEAVAQSTVKDVTSLIKTYGKWKPPKKSTGGQYKTHIDQIRYDFQVMMIREYEGRAATAPPPKGASSSAVGADGKFPRQQVLYQLRYQRVPKVDLTVGVA